MTKNQDLQKELLEKVKPGVKASDLKKLKKSKSADDIVNTPTSNPPLKKSQSQLEIPLTQPSKDQQITQLKEQVKFHTQTAQNYLQSLQISQAKVSELEEKLKNKPPSAELDNSLFARHQNLKDWFQQYQKTKQLDQELAENVNEASEELINQDQVISTLRTENKQLKSTNQSLQKDLKLAERLAELRKVPWPDDHPNWDYLKLGFYSLLAIGFTLWLLHSKPTQ